MIASNDKNQYLLKKNCNKPKGCERENKKW